MSIYRLELLEKYLTNKNYWFTLFVFSRPRLFERWIASGLVLGKIIELSTR